MKNDSFITYLTEEVLREIEGISVKRMFSGYGIYQNGIIFAFVDNDIIYFKVGESNKKDYEERGSKPFSYPMKNGKTTILSYWELPEGVIEEREEIKKWVEKAVFVSLQAKKSKKNG